MIESLGSSSLSSRPDASASARSRELSAEQQRQIQELREIDRKVRAHEQAHIAVGRDLVRGGATYTYQVGPDDKRYAVSGEVSIDGSPGRTPEETIPKAQHIRETALAPADPSAQDRNVASAASRMEAEAQLELLAKQREESSQSASSDSGKSDKADTTDNSPATESSRQSGARLYQSVAQSGDYGTVPGMMLNSFA